ncbi:MAG TPA: hypothetical protein VLK65_06710 [Vicinamibacteria bacterium]|nr:hypothetical protein [Vicinamibacteria bacterium]
MLSTDAGDLMHLLLPLLAMLTVAAICVLQEIRAHRWNPSLFRGGVVALRDAVPLARGPIEVPLPSSRRGYLGFRVRAVRLGPDEVAFFAPFLKASILRGLLRYNAADQSLEVIGRLHWGLWALLASPVLFGLWPFVTIGLLATFAYLGERRQFSSVLGEAAASVPMASN